MEKVLERVEKLEKNTKEILELIPKKQPSQIVNCELKEHQLEGFTWLEANFKENCSSILADDMGLGKTLTTISDYDVIITSYEMIIKETDFLSSFNYQVLVVDEAQRLKNSQSVLYTTFSHFKINFKLLLTGTPIQNNMKELFALIHFVQPEIFNHQDKFLEEFPEKEFSSKQVDSKKSELLKKILKPFILRRNKDVLKDLPKKKEILLYSPLSKMQKRYYIGLLKKDIHLFNKSRSLMNIIMSLRKCCNHPYLFQGAEPEPFEEGEHIIENSGKMIVLDKLLSKLFKQGHKVLIFSQMTSMLDIIQDFMHLRKYNYERIDGSVRSEERNVSISNFIEKDIFVFLLSTRVGGVGLNLTIADTVIFIDQDFNPMVDKQAQERVYRIGQKKDVTIYRILMKDTVEEIMLKKSQKKMKLSENIIENQKLTEKTLFDNEKLIDFVKFGLYNIIQTKEEEIQDFDIDKLLQEAEVIDEEVIDKTDENMYSFEGKNYKQDQKEFEKLSETDNLFTPLPVKKVIVVKDNLESSQEEQPKKKRRRKIGDYESSVIEIDTDEMNSDFEDEIESVPLNFVIGDVTNPSYGKNPKIVINCLSNTGSWGRGGLFTSISKVSDLPQKNYELAKKNNDLRLGDSHLIKITDSLYICNCIVQKKDKKSNIGITGVLLPLLEQSLNSVAFISKKLGASVHLPRIGSGLPNFNWYGTERIIRKCLSEYGIPTYVYYYKKGYVPPIKKEDQEIFESLLIGIYNVEDEKILKRKILSNGGIIVQLPTDHVDIILTDEKFMDDTLIKYSDEIQKVQIFKSCWIEDSISEGSVIIDEKYLVTRVDTEKISASIDPDNFY